MLCSKCQRTIPDDSEFCLYCGSKQEEKLICHSCGKDLPSESEFCLYCGATLSKPSMVSLKDSDKVIHKDQNSNRGRMSLIIAIAAIIIAITAVVLVILLNRPPQSDQATNEKDVAEQSEQNEPASIDELIASSQFIGIAKFKENPAAVKDVNLHLSGYVIEGSPNDRVIGMTVAESMDTPYDFEDVFDYFPLTFSIEESNAYKAEFDSWPKTATVYAELLPDGQCIQVPIVGDYVDVFFIGDGRVKVSAYCIKVH